MADRRVRLILEAQVDRFNANIRQAKTESEGLGKSLRTAVNSQEMQQLGRHMTMFGAATLAGLGMAVKAAIDWETAWVDVMRRTDGTPEQLQKLEDGLRGIATELPTTHAEIAAVAAAAAQLGIHVDDVEEFTRVMIDMGVSTNMTAEQAATSMARFANVMGTPTAEMRNLGSAVVDLGNNAATTESEIMDMGMRLAGAGRQAGLSEGDVLGMATAMSSLGIESQAGGTALSRTMTTIGLEVDLGGDKLETFAEVAGMTSQEFSAAWKEDAAGALIEFVGGLAGAEERGESMNAILQDLGITAIREGDVLRRLASNTDLLTASVDRGNEAFTENTALADEAGYVYESVASQIQAFWSNIQDAAITLGQSFLPALEATVNWLSEAVSFFADLPGPVQSAAGWIGLLAGALMLAAGSAILLAPGLMATNAALTSMGMPAGVARKGLVGLTKAVGALGIAFAAFQGVQWLNENLREGSVGADAMVLELNKLADSGGHASEALSHLGSTTTQTVSGIGSGTEEYSNLADSMDILDTATWKLNASQRDAVDTWNDVDEALAHMVGTGSIEQAVDQFSELSESARENGRSVEEVAAVFPELTSAIMKWADQNDVAITGAEAMAWAVDGIEPAAVRAAGGVNAIEEASAGAIDPMAELEAELGEVGLAADGTVESLEAFLAVLFETGMLTMSARDAQFAFEEQMRSMDEAVQAATDSLAAEHEAKGMSAEAAAALAAEQMNLGAALNSSKTDFDATTAAGKAAQDQFSATMDMGMRMTETMADAGATQEELQGSLRGTYDGMIETATGFGLGKEAAEALTREVLGIPDGVTIDSWMSTEAEETANALGLALDRQDGRVTRSSHIHTIIEQRRSSGNNSGARDLERAFYGQGRQNSGGAVFGAGTGTSDEIPRWLSNGEHVLDAQDVQLLGGQGGVYEFRRSLHDGGSRDQRPAGRDMVPASGGAASQARQFAAAMSSSGGGNGGSGTPVESVSPDALRSALTGMSFQFAFGQEKAIAKMVRVGEGKLGGR